MRKSREAISNEERHDRIVNLPANALYSIADASQLLGCSVRKIYQMMDDKRLRYLPPTVTRPHRRIKGVSLREAYFNSI